MGQRLTSDELTEWQAFYLLEPWGTEPAALNTAIVSSTIANVNRGKDTPVYHPIDFMPKYGVPKPAPQVSDADRFDKIRNLLKRD